MRILVSNNVLSESIGLCVNTLECACCTITLLRYRYIGIQRIGLIQKYPRQLRELIV